MIDQADDRVIAWITAVVGASVPVSATAPDSAPPDASGIDCYLLDVAPAPVERSAREAPLQLALRYLVTTRDADLRVAHRLLGQLVFAALDDTSLEVERTPLAPEMWLALGITPRPALVVRVPLRVERSQPQGPRVRHPIEIKGGHVLALVGRVIGPGDIPIANARVEVLGQNAQTLTDHAGRFRFAAIPRASSPFRLRVNARGVQTEVEQRPTDTEDGILTVRLPVPES